MPTPLAISIVPQKGVFSSGFSVLKKAPVPFLQNRELVRNAESE
jgi:hypothetical protein